MKRGILCFFSSTPFLLCWRAWRSQNFLMHKMICLVQSFFYLIIFKSLGVPWRSHVSRFSDILFHLTHYVITKLCCVSFQNTEQLQYNCVSVFTLCLCNICYYYEFSWFLRSFNKTPEPHLIRCFFTLSDVIRLWTDAGVFPYGLPD